MKESEKNIPVVPKGLVLTFVLVTILFPLWGFANDITNPMVAAFKNILLISNFESSLVQAAFYGGYALMAIPAAIFIKKYSYKKGVLIGLALYSLACLMFIPSGMAMSYPLFLLSYLVMTSGLSFLETTANPYILSMGDERTATRRLNLSQAFNPMGSITGMFVASMFILAALDGTSESGRRQMKELADNGTPVHLQEVNAQLSAVADLTAVTSEPGWQDSKKLLKKASALAGAVQSGTFLLDNKNASEADAIQTAVAAQPKGNKFKAAIEAVAVVMQVREQPAPTEAEAQRNALFVDGRGLELTLALNEEAPLLAKANDAKWNAAEKSLAQATAPAAEINVAMNSENAAAMAAIPGLLAGVKTELEAAKTALEAIPSASLQAHQQAAVGNLAKIQKSDLNIVSMPYALMGGFLILVLGLFAWKLPKTTKGEHAGDGGGLDLGGTLRRLFHNKAYLEGVVAQTFYVGAQIMCWTFIVQYGESQLGLSKSTAQNCNILAMIIFVSSRFVCTFLMHYISSGALLSLLASGAILLTTGAIFVEGYAGLYCLIGVSACMSLMFPTIYGIALEGLGDDAKLGSAGLILAIGGGCIMTPLQGRIIDLPAFDLGFMELASVRASFALPLICFIVIMLYGWRTFKVHHAEK
ncbi:L-fucose-proton symporter [Pontiella sulfatireligans]|uniref:L-fucose-proton symporter n=1 Tax=Pontiella sulfatireligans TaxID=2750658 RepID=A0A6C2UV38_9BACT|nr:MFS transporter [Pontiella sulfatireligans]VGO23034.1 L-fucose-proton symporter [Pontiella sulfatireligans]